MKPIQRRVAKLEARLLPQPETWESQQLWERIESGRRRVEAIYGEHYFSRREFVPNLSLAERLDAGRVRAHLRYLADRKHSPSAQA
jgi:hypothetical protein